MVMNSRVRSWLCRFVETFVRVERIGRPPLPELAERNAGLLRDPRRLRVAGSSGICQITGMSGFKIELADTRSHTRRLI